MTNSHFAFEGAGSMKRHPQRDMTLEEFDAWAAASDRTDAVAQAADEEGGPRLSLVPLTERDEVWPTDLLPPAARKPPAAARSRPAASPAEADRRDPVRRRRAGGQPQAPCRLERRAPAHVLCNLAETGSVHLASAAARLTARSAYRLRARSPAFAAAGTRGPARGRAALRHRFRPRDQRPHRAGLAGRRAGRGETARRATGC